MATQTSLHVWRGFHARPLFSHEEKKLLSDPTVHVHLTLLLEVYKPYDAPIDVQPSTDFFDIGIARFVAEGFARARVGAGNPPEQLVGLSVALVGIPFHRIMVILNGVFQPVLSSDDPTAVIHRPCAELMPLAPHQTISGAAIALETMCRFITKHGIERINQDLRRGMKHNPQATLAIYKTAIEAMEFNPGLAISFTGSA